MEQLLSFFGNIRYGRLVRQLLTITFIILSLYMSVPGILFIFEELKNTMDKVEIINTFLTFMIISSLMFSLVSKLLVKRINFAELFIMYILFFGIVVLGLVGYERTYIYFMLTYVGLNLLIIIAENLFYYFRSLEAPDVDA